MFKNIIREEINLDIERQRAVCEELVLVNIVEELVKDRVNALIGDFDMCSCRICRMNACALALNELPPKYVTTTRGVLFALVSVKGDAYQTAVDVEVAKALEKVKDHPLHD